MSSRIGLFVFVLGLVATPATSQSIPAKGTDATFDVATWNIRQFGNSVQQFNNAKAVIEQADIDLWAVQEITDPNEFNRLVSALGDGYAGRLANSGSLRIGYIYKTDVITTIRSVQHILVGLRASNNLTLFASRPPLQMEAEVTVADTSLTITFIVLHMKCCGDPNSHIRRKEASERLKIRIDFTALDTEPVIVLGDFNDELEDSITSGRDTPFRNFLDDPDDFTFLTLPLDQQNIGTFCFTDSCNSGSTIDHILVSNELVPFYEAGSIDRFHELTQEITRYRDTTSDHLPVFASFRFDKGTATEEETVSPALAVDPVYPNPFQHQATLTYRLPNASTVRVEVFDVLGRHVETLANTFQLAGEHHVRFDASDHAPGLYFVRLVTNESVTTQRVIHR